MRLVVKGPQDATLYNSDGTKFELPVRKLSFVAEGGSMPILALELEIYNQDPQGQRGFELEILEFDLTRGRSTTHFQECPVMKIFIPTRDRMDAQFTWQNLTQALRERTLLVCPAEELEGHLRRSRNAVARPPVPLAGVRQWLVDEACDGPTRGLEPIIMLDDDLAFFFRKSPSTHNLEQAKGKSDFYLEYLFQRLECLVGGGTPEGMGGPEIKSPVVHAGLSPRQGNNWAFPDTVQYNTRMNAVHCVLPAALRYYGIRYDDVDMMEDYHVTLSLFEKGEGNAAITDAAWDQCKGSGAPGGFSHYRTADRQTLAARRLAELHPDVVKVVTKAPKTGSGGFAGERTDVRVQWKKCAENPKSPSTFVR
jgi:hypothetical protein